MQPTYVGVTQNPNSIDHDNGFSPLFGFIIPYICIIYCAVLYNIIQHDFRPLLSKFNTRNKLIEEQNSHTPPLTMTSYNQHKTIKKI